ncbi:MAG TPA: UDP-N-acetylmuramoyl-L-alanyl-D-glutamate--2,6-diaminopimelate ligase [candidate division WOR-3 bacterium]|uniref:UDP-N-acetylmuramoyl-L-alanyl-D-glutamate--2,6-diaminopimelate ligase n=1 Tax=candidate division WOR-3 bacterium TaxID=2052148 RepID=A0A7V0T4U5_UNCW3|nr:UDP-N-acetylmuramoyl-L-alanyl-D-glutamate--2,6-diaminopimelate ligase [candidate division WOR-3 bacterium]
MTLNELVGGIPGAVVRGDGGVTISNIAFHSGRVEPGGLFVAVDGFRVSGADYAGEAVSRGAVAVAAGRGAAAVALPQTVARVEVDDARKFLALAADRFYGHPSRRLSLVGITGTNGKTTTAWLLRAVCRHLGYTAGLIGTVEHWDGRQALPAGQTTPESLDFTRLLARMVENRARVCLAEVSSHALALDRVYGQRFAVGVFTNLTRDHLDFHRTQDEYRAAKMKLFAGLDPDAAAVINADDPVGAEIPGLTRARVISYGVARDGGGRPDILGRVTEVAADGLGVELAHEGRVYAGRLQLIGRHNLANLMAAFGAGLALGWEPAAVLWGAEQLASVPGRLEPVPADRPFSVFVDYAHTPDALERTLATVREFTTGRVLVVFGCGGDRDRAKRPLMGGAVARGTDLAVVTSDNPRTEDPAAIIAEILPAMTGPCAWLVLPDREEAIARVLGEARSGDTVLIAGKGHEDYQIIGTEKRPFDDRAVARRFLAGEGA